MIGDSRIFDVVTCKNKPKQTIQLWYLDWDKSHFIGEGSSTTTEAAAAYCGSVFSRYYRITILLLVVVCIIMDPRDFYPPPTFS